MNKVISFVTSLFIFCLPGLSLHAQQEEIPPPSPPFLSRLPDHAAWRITYTSKQAPTPTPPVGAANATNAVPAAPQPRVLKEVDGVKMDQTRQEIYQWSDKQTTEHWSYGGSYLLTQLDNPGVYIFKPSLTNPGITATIPDYSVSDFPEFSWVSLENYKSIVIYQQHKCYFFQAQKQSVAPTPFPLPASVKSLPVPVKQAWIDVKTKLPVALNDGTVLGVYAIREIPQRDMELPPKFAEEYAKWQKAWAPALRR
jgi:hypothetical protein